MEDDAHRSNVRPRSGHHVDRWLGALIVAVALASGLVAAHFGSHRAWERSTTGTTTTPDHVQGSK